MPAAPLPLYPEVTRYVTPWQFAAIMAVLNGPMNDAGEIEKARQAIADILCISPQEASKPAKVEVIHIAGPKPNTWALHSALALKEASRKKTASATIGDKLRVLETMRRDALHIAKNRMRNGD